MLLDEAVSAKLAELEIVMNDLERANERVALSEREKDLLKAKLDAPHGSRELEEKYNFLSIVFSLSLLLLMKRVSNSFHNIASIEPLNALKRLLLKKRSDFC